MSRTCLAAALLAWTTIAPAAVSMTGPMQAVPRALTIDERVEAQRAVEDVYWRHRTWPSDNHGAKPPLAVVLPDAAIRDRVADSLARSAALEALWSHGITTQQLQREMDRMARQSANPEMLRELFAALHDDPRLIAETLARDVLSDRLARDWYAFDDRFHGMRRKEIERALEHAPGFESMHTLGGEYQETTFSRVRSDEESKVIGPDPRIIALDDQEWAEQKQKIASRFGASEDEIPLRRLTSLQEDAEGYSVLAVVDRSYSSITVASVSWKKQPFDAWWRDRKALFEGLQAPISGPFTSSPIQGSDCERDSWRPVNGAPEARVLHTAVWTGTEMLVWGGGRTAYGYLLNSGSRYDPATDTWRAMSYEGALPAARLGHVAVWTGLEMIVWGGSTYSREDSYVGGRYDPVTDRWAAIHYGGYPIGAFAAVWTGTEMIVWGIDLGGPKGARYDPHADRWTPISAGTNAPHYSGYTATAVWTGSEMIVWGGGGADVSGRYDPVTDTWKPVSSGANEPSSRSYYTAVWTGREMIVWGGYVYPDGDGRSGGRYDPVTDSWAPTAVVDATPAARTQHVAIWTGNEMVVWGGRPGEGSAGGPIAGGRYNPSTDTWTAMAADGGMLSLRPSASAVWTGTEMIVWGGEGYARQGLRTGGRYDPASDRWVPTSTGPAGASARSHHTATWTGAEMTVWGGYDDQFTLTVDGGRYVPAIDDWRPVSTEAAPSPRSDATAVWTGQMILVWGGAGAVPRSPGGRYDPTSDSWSSILEATDGPEQTFGHTAVWTGSEMIVWGGASYDGAPHFFAAGGRYDPLTDSWRTTGMSASPTARSNHSAVWTGSTMVVWGGSGGSALRSGGRYDPVSDTWSATSIDPETPTARWDHTAVWTGDRMIVWGGFAGTTSFGTGATYDPITDAWSSLGGIAEGRHAHSAIWSGAEMIVWGGEPSTDQGFRYRPTTRVARTIPYSYLQWRPTARSGHTAVWTGDEMILWGGTPESSVGGAYCGRCPEPIDVWWDFDQDGYGNSDVSWLSCDGTIPAGYSRVGSDCDDSDAGNYPDGVEVCDGRDNNCDGRVDEKFGKTYYFDYDRDGFGDSQSSLVTCLEPPLHYVTKGGDCNDGDAAIHPGAAERCNSKDDDCDGLIDENPRPPAAVTGLRLWKTSGPSLMTWNASNDGKSYDIVRGSLIALISTHGDFGSAASACLHASGGATSLTDNYVPGAGESVWYLIRSVGCGAIGTYDSGAPAQVGSRDAGLATSPLACP